MECTAEFLNVSQIMINSLKEGINMNTYFCFKPEEAAHLIRIIDLFCDTRSRYIEVSFYNDPEKDQTIGIKVCKQWTPNHKPLITYFDQDVKGFLTSFKITKTEKPLRELVKINFI